MNQRGAASLILVLLLLIGIGVGTYLVGQRTNPFSKAESSSSTTSSVKPQYGSFLFYWHDCPSHNCDLSRMVNKPVDPATYSSVSLNWYKSQFKDMADAGLNIVFPVSWGSGHPTFTWFRDTTDVPLMVQAISEDQLPLKLALFDDTNSEDAEWNNDNGRGYLSAAGNPSERQTGAYYMPLSDDKNWMYFYDRHIKQFFTMVPQSMWATHNGKSIDDGGRPIVITYSGLYFKDPEYSDEMWTAIKNSFKNDFKDSHGNGIDPFIILNYDWFDYNPQKTELEAAVDGKYVWGGGNYDIARQYTLHNYTTADISSGINCNTSTCIGKPRTYNIITGKNDGDEGTHLRTMFQKYGTGNDLILVESWNELWEGTGLGRSNDYFKNGGGTLEPDYYIKLLKNLIDTNVVATPTPPPNNSFVSSANLNSQIRNDYGDYVGMKITVGAAPITVTDLGRYYVSDNTQSHTLKIIEASTGIDKASVSLLMNPSTPDSLGYKYASLSTPVTLAANTSYYLVSSEFSGGDQWYGNTILPAVTSTQVATINSGIYHAGNAWVPYGGVNTSYGPLNFRYIPNTATPTPLPTATKTPSPTSVPTPRLTPTPVPTPTAVPNGLTGQYFNNQNLSGTAILNRTDSTVDFNWGNSSPANNISVDHFSVRWTGQVKTLTAGNYRFCTTSDDGSRLWINNLRVVDKWRNQSPTQSCRTISLQANKLYPLKMEYYENDGGAVAKLQWATPGQSIKTIPSANLFIR